MKIHIEVDPDEGQSVIVQTRDMATGSDGGRETVGPGQVGVFDMPDGHSIALIHGPVHYDNGSRDPAIVPDAPVISGDAVTERPTEEAKDAPELTPADPAKVAEVAKAAVDNGAGTTADGKINVAELNAALAEQGHAPVTAVERDAAHEANAAV